MGNITSRLSIMSGLMREHMLGGALCFLLGWAPVTQGQENLHLYGRLITTLCTLEGENGVLDAVTFPEMAASDLMLRGKSAPVPVTITLKNCQGATLANGVRVTFSGTEVSNLTGYLALDSGSLASGFGIGLMAEDGVPIAFNDATGRTFMLNAGDNTLVLSAWLQTIAGQSVISGTFTATATATFEYL